jgi:anti-sigma factor RsiW
MTREFPDEMLSAFLDDELSPAERAQVEKHLAASPADRLLLAELQSLKSDMANLPPVVVKPDFADRVVQAALAEAEKHSAAQGVVSQSPPVERPIGQRWKIGVAAVSAVALAASLLLVVRPWRPGPSPEPVGPLVVNRVPPAVPLAALPEQFLGALASALPSDREAVVLRLRVSRAVPFAAALDAALAKAQIAALGSDRSSSAALLQDAYQRSLQIKIDDSTLAATHAVFIEAPLERLQGAIAELAATIKDPLTLETEGKLALSRAWDENRAEGESPQQAFVQHLNASQFRLQKDLTVHAIVANSQPTPVRLNPQQRVRVLILVEAE